MNGLFKHIADWQLGFTIWIHSCSPPDAASLSLSNLKMLCKNTKLFVQRISLLLLGRTKEHTVRPNYLLRESSREMLKELTTRYRYICFDFCPTLMVNPHISVSILLDTIDIIMTYSLLSSQCNLCAVENALINLSITLSKYNIGNIR